METLETPLTGDQPRTSQLILGADRRNPVFSVYRDTDREELQVYFGFELIETLAEVPGSPACKLLVARLYNAGFKVKSLSEVFAVDPKTIRRWGVALRSGDADELIRVLEGRGGRRKLTAPIESFVRLRLRETALGHYGAIKRLCQEIKDVFQVEISTKTLGALVRQLKADCPRIPWVEKSDAGDEGSVGAGESNPVTEAAASGSEEGKQTGEIASACLGKGSENIGFNPIARNANGDEAGPAMADDNGKLSPCLPCPVPQSGHVWCDHAGLLIFAESLITLSGCVKPAQPILTQWLGSLLLGAQNIEQTKFLNWEDLQLMLGPVVRCPMPQRLQLRTLGTEDTLAGLFTFNAGVLDGGVGTDFYFDPHTKHYTGEQNVLKGWCAKIRWADKILQSDFIHTAGGAPIYFETTDNFEDLRQRFFAVIDRARSVLQWPAEQGVTYVVDRGIFGQDVFDKILADPRHHLITWQKGFVAGKWEAAQASGSLMMTFC